MHTACTSVGLRMDIAAKAETICPETPRSVKDCILLLKGARSSIWGRAFGESLFGSVGFRASVEGKSLARPTGGLGNLCKVVEENTEVGGFGEGDVCDAATLATPDSTSLSDPASLSHSSNRMRLVGLGDSDSVSNSRLSPIIIVRVLGHGKKARVRVELR